MIRTRIVLSLLLHVVLGANGGLAGGKHALHRVVVVDGKSQIDRGGSVGSHFTEAGANMGSVTKLKVDIGGTYSKPLSLPSSNSRFTS